MRRRNVNSAPGQELPLSPAVAGRGGKYPATIDRTSRLATMAPMATLERTIELRVREPRQLFNSLDPSPFHEKDLDDDAEEYIVDWARELPREASFLIVIHLPEEEACREGALHLEEAIRNYFAYRADVFVRDLKEHFRLGRRALAVGLSVLSLCLLARHLVTSYLPSGPLGLFFQEGLLIFGWVANWKPAEIFLYDWLPLTRRRDLYRRLAAARVEIRPQTGP
jgi:hypothetical protein